MDNLKELLLKSAGIVRDSINVEDTIPTINAPRGGKEGTHSNPHATRKGTPGKKQDINVQRAGTEGKEGDFQIIRTGTRKTYPSPEYQDHENYRSPDATTKTADRGGSDGKETEISIIRGGVKGTQSDVDIQRGGTKGGNSDITIKRGGIQGTQSDIVTERSGKDGSTSEVKIRRAGVEGSHTDSQYEPHKHQYDGENFNPEVIRTGTQKVPVDLEEYKTSHSNYNSPSSTTDTPERSGSEGSKTDIRVDRSGTPGTQSDVDIQRGGNPGSQDDIHYQEHHKEDIPTAVDTAERSGIVGSNQEIDVTRGGTPGKTQDQEYQEHFSNYDGSNFDAGVVRTGTQGIPKDSEDYEFAHDSYESPSSSTETAKRGGQSGKTSDIHVERPSGNPSETDYEYVGYEEYKSPESTTDTQKRNPSEAQEADVEYQEHNYQSPDSSTETAERTGTPGSDEPLTLTDIIKAEIAMTEIGKAQLDESATLIKEQTQLPNDVNEWSMNNTQRWYDKLSNTLGRINRIAENVIGFGGFLGLKLPNITNLNTWLKMIPGSPGVELITGFNASNQDLIAYCKFMCNSPENWVRIAADLLLRYTTIPLGSTMAQVEHMLWSGDTEGYDKASPVAKAAITLIKLVNNLLKIKGKSYLMGQRGQKVDAKEAEIWDELKNKRSINEKFNAIGRPSPYNGGSKQSSYQFMHNGNYNNSVEDEQIHLEDISRIFKDHQRYSVFDSENGKQAEYAIRQLAGAIVNGKIEESDDWFAGYARWQDFEFSDDMWWGCSIYPYAPDNNQGFSRLPQFPPQYQNGWWPVVAASFNKGSIRSKSFNLPFFDLDLPVSATRPSQLRITFVDDARRSIRYWLEEYIRLVFDFDTNSTVPYKHLCLLIEFYRYDITRAVLYRKKFICMIKDPTSVFNGGNSHQLDEIDIEFNIVGEQTDRDLYRKYELYNPLQS